MRAEVWLEGGAEYGPGYEEMDAEALGGDDGPRRVVVLPFAGRPGRERVVAGANARQWFEGLGAREVEVVLDESAVPAALAGAGLVVLPGGSPGRLLAALRPHRAALDAALDAGVRISGSSAGAMVLCRWTVVPGGSFRVEEGLGLVAVDLVVPHYRAGTSWVAAARPSLPPEPVVLGLPERAGVVVSADGSLRPAGPVEVTRLG